MRGSGKPKPFKNPRIEVSTDASYGVKKEWAQVIPARIAPGDIVRGRDLGLVTEIRDYDDLDVVIFFKNGTQLRWSKRSTLMAFVKVQGG